MKKSILWITVVMLIGALLLSAWACNKHEDTTPDVDAPVQAEGITLDKTHVLAVVGSTVTLSHSLEPDTAQGSVTYTSSDESVVRVTAAGECSAVASGVATVTARVGDRYAECRVVVGDAVVIKNIASQTAEQEQTSPDTTSQTAGDETQTQPPAQSDGENTNDDNTDTSDGLQQDGATQDGDTSQSDQNQTNDTAIDTPEENGADTGEAGENAGESTQNAPDDTPQSDTQPQNGVSFADSSANVALVGTQAGVTLFDSVQAALNTIADGKTVLVNEGEYDEAVNVLKNVTIQGVGNPVVRQITVQAGCNAKLYNLTVQSTRYPSAGEAAIVAKTGATLTVKDCVLRTDTTQELEGGYAVLVEKQSGGVYIENNSLANFRYGIYVCPTSQSITIRDNRLSNMTTGIGVDVRQENAEADYPATGSIVDNEYNEVEHKTQFFHYGENYEGELDFGDNEEENASNGEAASGGSGLLE